MTPLEEFGGFELMDNFTSTIVGLKNVDTKGPRARFRGMKGYSEAYQRRAGFGTAIDLDLSWKVMLDQESTHDLLCSDLRTDG